MFPGVTLVVKVAPTETRVRALLLSVVKQRLGKLAVLSTVPKAVGVASEQVTRVHTGALMSVLATARLRAQEKSSSQTSAVIFIAVSEGAPCTKRKAPPRRHMLLVVHERVDQRAQMTLQSFLRAGGYR